MHDDETTPAVLSDEPVAATLADVVRLLKALRDGHAAGPPQLLSAPAAARLCGMSTASWHRLRARDGTPRPVRIAGMVRYRRAELLEWIAAGLPDRATWE